MVRYMQAKYNDPIKGDAIREKIRKSNEGKTHSKEARAKMREKAQGRPGSRLGQSPSEETRAKLRAFNLGKKLSEETRAKMKGRKAPNNRCVKTGWTEQPFASIKLASEWAIANGIANARRKIFNFLKIDPINFYYITKEEYIMLTGKEP